MNNTETYRHWIRVILHHEYYVSGIVPIKVIPAKETQLLLAKSGILFRKYSESQWNLLLPTAEKAVTQLTLHAEEAPVMQFELTPASNEIYYNSRLDEQTNDTYRIAGSNIPKVWKKLEIPFTVSLLQSEAQIQLHIQSPRKHIEFILIPKYNPIDTPLRLSEEKGRIEFDEIEHISLFNGIEAYRFRSKEPVTLSENNHYKIKLWQKRKAGNRLLCEALPFPRYDELSAINPDKTISTYFYY